MHIEERKVCVLVSEERNVYFLVRDDGTEEIINDPHSIAALEKIFTHDAPAHVEQEKPVIRKRAQNADESSPPIAEMVPVKRRGRPPKAKHSDVPSPALAEVRKMAAEAHLI